jgi:hypothetical protein
VRFGAAGRFDQPSRSGAEMPVLQALTAALGPGVWLNTVVALTHGAGMEWGLGAGCASGRLVRGASSAVGRPPV